MPRVHVSEIGHSGGKSDACSEMQKRRKKSLLTGVGWGLSCGGVLQVRLVEANLVGVICLFQ